MALIPFNGSPVLGGDGTIYAVAGKVQGWYQEGIAALLALYPDGTPRWRLGTAEGIEGDPLPSARGLLYLHGRFPSPAGHAEQVADVVAIDATTGAVVGEVRVGVNAYGPVKGPDDVFYAFPSTHSDYLLARTPAGEQVWVAWKLGHPYAGDPAVGPGGLVLAPADLLGGRYCLYALGPGGEVVWRHDLSAPVRLDVGPKGPVVAWGRDGLARAFGPGGEALWAREVGPPGEAVAAFGPGGVAYLATADGRVLAVAPDGATRWAVAAPGAVTGGLRADGEGALYFGCADGAVYALDPGGALRWRHPTGGAVRGVPAVGADGAVYAGSDDGHLYALGPDGRERWRFSAGIERASSP